MMIQNNEYETKFHQDLRKISQSKNALP